MYTSPDCTYARVGIRDPAHMYVCGRIYFLAPWPLYLHVRATCAPLIRHMRASTSTYIHVRDQNDNAMYASTRWVPTVKHFLVCKDVAGGSQQSGGKPFFSRNMEALPCVRRCSWSVPVVRGNLFFVKYGCPSGGSLLSGGGIIIFRIIRTQFLAAAVDPAVSLSTYSTFLMEVIH